MPSPQMLPTLTAAAGGTPPSGIDGQDLLALLAGTLPRPRRYLCGLACDSHPRPDDARYLGITDGRWKYIWYPEGAAEQLFDLQADPQETKDLARAKEFDAKRRELRADLICEERARGIEADPKRVLFINCA